MEPWPTAPSARSGSALALLAVLVLAVDASAQPLVFRIDGEDRGARSVAELREQFAPTAIRVFEPYEEATAEFVGVAFNAVLDAVYGNAWRARDEVLLTCRDGYQPSFPVSRLLAYDAWLAIDRKDAESFTILKLERGERVRVDLSPVYLVWDNLGDPGLRDEGDYGWPYQLVGVDLIDARERFPNMTPPPGSTAQVAAGYEAFRMHCTRCHQVNGEGGVIGPELNSPANPTEYREASWLKQWIDDPASLVATARMPRLNPRLDGRESLIDDVIAYLEAMSKHKVRLPAATEDAS